MRTFHAKLLRIGDQNGDETTLEIVRDDGARHDLPVHRETAASLIRGGRYLFVLADPHPFIERDMVLAIEPPLSAGDN